MTDTTVLAKDEFCARFVARMMKTTDGEDAELRAYAEQIAPSYFEDEDQRSYGPEVCAESDISYWEE